MKTRVYFILLSGLAAALPVMHGQTAARIMGVVKDQSGNPVPLADINAIGQKSALKRAMKAEPDGSFVLAEMPPDSYQINATCETCNDVSSIVEVGAGQTRTVELHLDTKSASTEISVDKTATTMDSTSARLGTNATAPEIAALPVNGRTYGPLAMTAPLVTNSAGADFADLRFVGQSDEQNRFRLDGIDASSVVSVAPGYVPVAGVQFRLRTSVDTVQEFRVDSAMYSAEDGFGSGGQFKLVSKAGGTDWHGNVSEYFRNDKLSARNFFDGAQATKLRMNQFGGNGGGALMKDKLFVFGSLEYLRQRAGQNMFEGVPSSGAKAGSDPSIAPLLSLFPAGAATGDPDVNVSKRDAGSSQDESNLNVRADYAANLKNRLFARYSRTHGNQITPDITTTPRNISANTHPDNAALDWNSGLGASLINEFTAGLNRAPTSLSVDGGSSAAAGVLLIAGSGAAGSYAAPGGLVRLSNGDYGRGASYRGTSMNATDHLDWLLAAHSIKFGFELRAIRMPFALQGGTVYRYLTSDALLSNADADVTYTGDLPYRTAKQEQIAAYVQDEWRFRPNLTISMGLRYEYFSATREDQDRASVLDISTLAAKPARGGFYKASPLGFAPRLAAAWSPTRAKGKTVVRVGAGIYQGPLALLDTLQPIENGAIRSFLRGTVFPQTPASLVAHNATLLPEAFDAAGFQHMQRNISLSASVQQALPGQLVGQIAYVGTLSRHLVQQGTTNLGIGINPDTGAIVRANPGWGAIQYLTNGGTADYNGMQLGVTRRFVDNLTLSASYNWAHSVGDSLGTGEAQSAQNPNCFACEKASNNFDTRHTFSVNTVYALPLGVHQRYLNSGFTGRLVTGWALAGAWNQHSGLPVNVLIDRSDEFLQQATGRYVVNVPYGGEDRGAERPNVVPGVSPYGTNPKALYLNPAAFSIPLPGTLGNLGRNAFRGPAFSQLDMQVSRTFNIGERHRIQIRGEAFNLANHTNFAAPTTQLSNALVDVGPGAHLTQALEPEFGRLTSAVGRTVGLGTARQLQLSARYEF